MYINYYGACNVYKNVIHLPIIAKNKVDGSKPVLSKENDMIIQNHINKWRKVKVTRLL